MIAYLDLVRILRERLLFERARLLQQAELPTAASVYRFALHLELLCRLEEAAGEDDRQRLADLMTTAGRLVGA